MGDGVRDQMNTFDTHVFIILKQQVSYSSTWTVTTGSDSTRWTFLKDSSFSGIGCVMSDQPTSTMSHWRVLCEKSQVVQNQSAPVPAVFNFCSLEICIIKFIALKAVF